MDDCFEPAPFMWIEDSKGQAPTPKIRKKTKRKLEYVGWGSKELIEFLHSIGKDTTNALSQYDVTNLINIYINEKRLVHPNNKRRVLSDDNLYYLFNKKSFFRNKIHQLLEAHLVENQNNSDDGHSGSSDGEAVSKKQKSLSSIKTIQPKKKAPEVSKSCLVAINSENIKLVYLRKSLVQELVSNPETFENKVVGSFVRVKSDPHDIFQKNSHQLQLVTGVMEVVAAGDTRLSKILQVSGMADDISISELSDDNFSEEEIEDLRTRVKDGLLKQPTIGELEQKVVVLHEDVTKHWIAREIKLLKKLIDRANEKGWRPRVAEYLDRRKLLESPDEQSRLLSDIPKLMPEEVKPETITDSEPDDSPKAADWDREPYIASSIKVDTTKPGDLSDIPKVMPEEVKPKSVNDSEPDDSPKAVDWDREPCTASSIEVVMTKPEDLSKLDFQAAEISGGSNGEAHPLSPLVRKQPVTSLSSAINNSHVQPVVILSDDDDDDEEQKTPGGGGTQIPAPHNKPLGTPGRRLQIPGDGSRVLGGGTQSLVGGIPFAGNGIPISGGGTQISGGAISNSGGGTQIPGSGIPISGGVIPNSGGGIQIPGGGIQIPGGGTPISGGGTPISGGGTQIPGGGIPNSGGGTQLLGGGTQIPGRYPGQVVQQYLDPQNRGGNQILGPHPELLVWHYFDPQNRIQGPFSLMSLKRWSDMRYFPTDFKVWMSGQSPQKAIPLSLILQHIFPN